MTVIIGLVDPRKPQTGSGELSQVPSPDDDSRGLLEAQDALVETFFKDKDPKTVRTYRRLLEDFRLWLNTTSIDEAARFFLSKGQGHANLLAMKWKAHLVAEKYAPASINAHLVALRSLLKVARLIGLVNWSIEIQNVRHQAYRDTMGPGEQILNKVLADLRARSDPMAIRDRTLLSLIYDAGLRREEIVSIDIAHIDWVGHRIWVKVKKKTERVGIPINAHIEQELKQWIAIRGSSPGALFKNFDPAKKGDRLTGSAIGRISNKYGLGHVHGIRHLAITVALEETNGNIAEVMKFSRHEDPKTVMIYDDNRKNVSGAISGMLARRRLGISDHPKDGGDSK